MYSSIYLFFINCVALIIYWCCVTCNIIKHGIPRLTRSKIKPSKRKGESKTKKVLIVIIIVYFMCIFWFHFVVCFCFFCFFYLYVYQIKKFACCCTHCCWWGGGVIDYVSNVFILVAHRIENYHGSNTVFLVASLMSVVGGVFIIFATMALCYRSVVVHKNFFLCLRLVCR